MDDTTTTFLPEDSSSSSSSSSNWLRSPAELLYLSLLAFLVLLGAGSVFLDHRRRGLWSESYYFRKKKRRKSVVMCNDDGSLDEEAGLGGSEGAVPSEGTLRTSIASHPSTSPSTASSGTTAAGKSGEETEGSSSQLPDMLEPDEPPKAISEQLAVFLQGQCLHAIVASELWLAPATLVDSGLFNIDNFNISPDFSSWESDIDGASCMSPEFLQLHRIFAHRFPGFMHRVLEDNLLVLFVRLFIFWHPLFDIIRIDVEISSAKKALAFCNALMGSCLLATFFFRLTEAGPDSHQLVSPFEDPAAYIWPAFASVPSVALGSSFAYLSSTVMRRKISEECTERSRAEQLDQWKRCERIVLLYDCMYLAVCLTFTAFFTAQMNQANRWSVWVTYVAIVIHPIFLSPCGYATTMVVGMGLFRLLRPGAFQIPDVLAMCDSVSLKIDGDMRSLRNQPKNATDEDEDEEDLQALHTEVCSNAPSESCSLTACELLSLYRRIPELAPTIVPAEATIDEVLRDVVAPVTMDVLPVDFIDVKLTPLPSLGGGWNSTVAYTSEGAMSGRQSNDSGNGWAGGSSFPSRPVNEQPSRSAIRTSRNSRTSNSSDMSDGARSVRSCRSNNLPRDLRGLRCQVDVCGSAREVFATTRGAGTWVKAPSSSSSKSSFSSRSSSSSSEPFAWQEGACMVRLPLPTFRCGQTMRLSVLRREEEAEGGRYTGRIRWSRRRRRSSSSSSRRSKRSKQDRASDGARSSATPEDPSSSATSAGPSLPEADEIGILCISWDQLWNTHLSPIGEQAIFGTFQNYSLQVTPVWNETSFANPVAGRGQPYASLFGNRPPTAEFIAGYNDRPFLFRTLVAAVVADSLGQTSLEKVSKSMDNDTGLDALMQSLSQRDTRQNPIPYYWIQPLCVPTNSLAMTRGGNGTELSLSPLRLAPNCAGANEAVQVIYFDKNSVSESDSLLQLFCVSSHSHRALRVVLETADLAPLLLNAFASEGSSEKEGGGPPAAGDVKVKVNKAISMEASGIHFAEHSYYRCLV